jgi:sugar phosphate isomerase/epimerase
MPSHTKQLKSPRFMSLAALTVLELSPPDMIRVAAEAGYQGVGLRLIPATPEEHHFSLLTDPHLLRQTREALQQTGIKVVDIEILRLRPDTRVVEDFTAVLELGATLGASEILVAGNDDDHQRSSDNLSALCQLAATYGMNPHLEFMPWTGVKNLTEARAIVSRVRESGIDNACLLIDPFHFNRSHSRLEDLANIPPDWMRYAQLCDVAGAVPESMAEIIREARFERCFPGEGDIDLAALLEGMPTTIPVSIEVPTETLRLQGVSPLRRAQLALESALVLLG